MRRTFLQHDVYADFVPFFATLEDGRAVIAVPTGEGRTGFVPRLAGHPARSMAEHLHAHPEDWAHLRA